MAKSKSKQRVMDSIDEDRPKKKRYKWRKGDRVYVTVRTLEPDQVFSHLSVELGRVLRISDVWKSYPFIIKLDRKDEPRCIRVEIHHLFPETKKGKRKAVLRCLDLYQSGIRELARLTQVLIENNL